MSGAAGSRQQTNAPFTPSEAWIEEYDNQCTEDMLQSLRRYAMYLARLAGDRDGDRGATYAEELLQDALVDLATGALHWDPGGARLRDYLEDVLRLRARRDRAREERQQERQAQGHRIVSLDALSGDAHASVENTASLAMEAIAADRAAGAESEERMTQMMSELRVLAAADADALRILDAIETGGARRRLDIKRLTTLSTLDYRNARRRLARLATQVGTIRRRMKKGPP